ncbi:MAG: Smr/MutS family protein [Amylibacter sp.]|jgi:DNA-nicking Smr family endonuclease|tara:strand:+ start:30964 stop:31560 length:597 start_codon:yes stop_codon:yes gene_type:complete
MVGRKPRGLTQEDLEIWRQVAAQLKRDKPEIPMMSSIKGTRIHKAVQPLPSIPTIRSFMVGEKVMESKISQPPNFYQERQRTSPNMDGKNFQRLVRGQLEVEGTLDLHGLTADQAKAQLMAYITHSHAMGKRLIIVITGKGKHKGYDEFNRPIKGILRQNLPDWLSGPALSQKVLQVSQAQPKHGGSGAYYVYLRRKR